MNELPPEMYSRVSALFPNLDAHLAVRALLAGNVAGQVYVDDPARPQSVMARIGKLFYLGGSPENEAFNRELSRFLVETVYPQDLAAGREAFIVKCPVGAWSRQIDVLLPGKLPIPKCQHHYAGREVRHDWRAMLPPDITLRLVDRSLLDEGLEGLGDLLEEMCSERPSVDEFLDKSFGFVPVHGNRVVGWCLSEYNCGDRCEIGIATAQGYRRRGLATLIASALIEYAQAHGIAHIGWHCDADNAGSIATALKLGFTKVLEYPVYLCLLDETIHLAVYGEHCFRRQQYAEAALWYERALQRGDAPAWVYVDRACAHAMSAEGDQALRRLHEAVDRGFADIEYLRTCRWFEGLRDTAAWTLLLHRVEEKSGALS